LSHVTGCIICTCFVEYIVAVTRMVLDDLTICSGIHFLGANWMLLLPLSRVAVLVCSLLCIPITHTIISYTYATGCKQQYKNHPYLFIWKVFWINTVLRKKLNVTHRCSQMHYASIINLNKTAVNCQLGVPRTLSHVRDSVTNNNGFWIWWLGLLALLYNYNWL
jgi:hypothetical protein